MAQKEQNFGKANILPNVKDMMFNTVNIQGSIDQLYEGTYYLTKIDDKYRRFYGVKGVPLDPSTQGVQSAKTAMNLTSQTAQRLNTVNNQLLASGVKTNGKNGEKRTKDVDSSVMRSVVVNFHKKPLEERLNEVMKL